MPIPRAPKRQSSSAPARARGEQRRLQLVEAAYLTLAEKGFEGLRTRDVAERVGINIATLHYYFPSKEALISGVVGHLMNKLRRPEVSVPASANALECLRAEFADISVRITKSPEQLKVLRELSVRAWRDPVVAKFLNHLDAGWQHHLESILRDGIKQKSFRQDLDVEATAAAMMSQLRGVGYQTKLGAGALSKLVSMISQQVERWVTPSEAKIAK